MGQTENPTRFTEQTSQAQPLSAAFQRVHGNGARPEPFPPGRAKRGSSPRCGTATPRSAASPCRSPAQPGLSGSHCPMPRAYGLILRSQAMLPDPHHWSGEGHIWYRCCGDGVVRNSPGKTFLAPLPILAARARRGSNLSHSMPKLLVFSPQAVSLWGRSGATQLAPGALMAVGNITVLPARVTYGLSKVPPMPADTPGNYSNYSN